MGEYYTVFVYGSLKRGQPNHHVITNSTGEFSYIGTGQTVQRWPLVIASKYNIPFMLYAEGKGKQVTGEVYKVDSEVLKALDKLEEHPILYERIPIPVVLFEDSNGMKLNTEEPVECWCYILKKYKPEMIELHHFDCYDSYGDHGLEYVSSENLDNPDDL